MTNPITRPYTSPKLLSGYPGEIVYAWNIAREYVYHVGAEPRDGLLLQGLLPTPDMLSKGIAGTALGVGGEGIDPPTSLGVRFWVACPSEVHDVYGDPIPSKASFKAPQVTMGLVEFDEQSDKTVTVEEWGQSFAREAKITIPFIHHLENDIDIPREGDLVEFWARSWHELGVFYDVVHVARDGFVNDTNYYVQWILRLQRRDEFVPERRLLSNPDPVDVELPQVPEEDTVFVTQTAQQAFIVTNAATFTYVLAHEPTAGTEDIHWNGIHLVPGAGFAGFLPNVRGYKLSGSSLILSSNVILNVDDVLSVEYSYVIEV